MRQENSGVTITEAEEQRKENKRIHLKGEAYLLVRGSPTYKDERGVFGENRAGCIQRERNDARSEALSRKGKRLQGTR